MAEAEAPDGHKIDRLLDAIELVQAERRSEALVLLRGLIREDSDFEDAWLWMSLAVDSVDKSLICLENVLRINPHNPIAQAALFRLRSTEAASERQRERLRARRDFALASLWLLVIGLLFAVLFTTGALMSASLAAS